MPSTFFTPVMAEVGRERSLQKTKTHVLQNSDLRSLLEEEDPSHPRFTGSKGVWLLLFKSSRVDTQHIARHTATTVIVTIGPATSDVETMCELLRAGMSCARFDLTVCTHSHTHSYPPPITPHATPRLVWHPGLSRCSTGQSQPSTASHWPHMRRHGGHPGS